MKKNQRIARKIEIIVLSLLIASIVATNAFSQTVKDTDKDGIPDNAEMVLKTDPMNNDTDGDGINDLKDKDPLNTGKTFIKSSGQDGFSIKYILVEDNYDPTLKKDAPDHLEIKLQNNCDQDIKDLAAFYRITDLSTKQQESYIVPLAGFVLEKGQTKIIHIDLREGDGHFRANPNSLYYTSINKRKVDVIISAPGFLAKEKSVKKDAGGAEIPD